MSTEIDQRIVEMKFDNKNFEKNISTSMSSLREFKESLKFDGATKGIDEVSKAGSKFSLNGMSSAVEKVELKFNALQIAAITAISKIVSSAMDAGTKLVKSLSVDNIAAGWSKLEEKTASVQTIMNATGKSVDQVNDYLDKLMWFSDETSYGFTDMTAAIAQMTSSGGDINKLIPMVMGVANATAFAGKTAQEFSRVMYNLNQSYGAGYLQFMDWRSVELAGVASQQLKQVFIDTAVELGKINEGAVTLGTFGTTLKDKWADTEVMEKAFGKFAEVTEAAYQMIHGGVTIGDVFFEADTATEAYEILGKMTDRYDQLVISAAKAAQEAKTFGEVIDATKDAVSSKWMKTFELIFGNYEEAKELYSRLAEEFYTLFAEGGNTRNDMLFGGLASGLKQLQKQGVPDLEVLGLVALKAAEANGELSDELKAMVDESGHLDMDKFKESVKDGWLSADILDETLRGLTGDVRNYSKEQLLAMGYTEEQVGQLDMLAEAYLNNELNLEQLARMIQASGRDNLVAAFWNIWDALFAIDEETGKAIGIVSLFKEAVAEVFPSLSSDKIYEFTVRLKEWSEGLRLSDRSAAGLKKVVTLLATPVKWLIDLGGKGLKLVGTLLGKIGSLTSNFLGFISDSKNVERALNNLFGGERGTRLAEAYANAVERVRNALKTLKDRAKETWSNFKGSEAAEKGLSKIYELLTKIGSWILDKIIAGLEAIGKFDFSGALDDLMADANSVLEFFAKIPERIENFFTQIKGAKDVNGVLQVLSGYLDKIRERFREKVGLAQNGFAGALDTIRNYAEKLSPYIEQAKTVIGDFIKALTPAKVIAFAFSATLISMFINFSGLAEQFTNVGKSIGGFFKTAKSSAKVSVIVQVALAIGILTAALIALSRVDGESLKRSATYIAQFLGAMAAAAVAFGVMEKFGLSAKNMALNMLEMAASAILIAGAVAILVKALGALTELDAASVAGISLALLPIILELRLVFDAMGKITKKTNLLKGALGLTLMIGNLLLLVGALKVLKRVDPSDILAVIPQYLLLLAGLAGMALVMRIAGKNSGKFGVGILAMAGGLILLGKAVEQIGGLDKSVLIKGGAVVAGALVLFRLLIDGFGKSDGGKNAQKIGVAIAIMSASMLLLGVAIRNIGKIPTENLIKGSAVVGGLMLIMALIVNAAKVGEKGKSGMGTILAMTAAIGVICASIVVLSIQPWQDILTGAGALGIVMGAFALAVYAMNAVDWKKAITNIVLMTFMLGETVAAIYLLRNVDGTNAIRTATALSEIMLAVSGAVFILSKIKVTGDVVGSMLAFAGVLGGMVLLVNIIGGLMTDVDISEFETGISVLEKMCSPKFAAVVAGMAVLTGALGIIGNLGVDKIALGAAGFVVVVGVLTLLVGAIGELVNWADSDMTVLDKGVEVFKKIGDALGSFVGNIINGVLSGIGAGVSSVIVSLGQGIAGFFDAFSSIDSNATENLKDIAEALLVFGAAGVVTAISNILNLGSTGKRLGRQLEQFAPSLAAFADAVAGHDFSNVGAAAEGAKGLVEFVKALPKTGGWIQAITGEAGSLSGFAESIGAFGDAIVAFQESMPETGIDSALITSAVTSGEQLVRLQKALPKTGWFNKVFGEHDWGTFEDGIVKFAGGIVAFNNVLVRNNSETAIDSDLIDRVIDAGNKLAKLGDLIPESGGFVQKFSGEHDWDAFRLGIIKFAGGIVAFNNVLVRNGGLDADKMDEAVEAGKKLNKLNKAIPTTGGLLQELFGGKDLSGFATSIEDLGTGMHNFYAQTMGLDKEKFDKAASMVESLATISNSLDDEGGLQGLIYGNYDLSDFGLNLTEFGGKLVEYFDSIKEVDWASTQASIDIINQIVSMATTLMGLDTTGMFAFNAGLETMAEGGIVSFTTTFANAEETFNETGSNMVTYIFAGIKTASDTSMPKAAIVVITAFKDGFSDESKNQMPGIASDFTELFVTSVKAEDAKLQKVGVYVVQGIIRGITKEWPLLLDTSRRKMEGLVTAMQNEMKIESPSKVMRDEVGTYIVQGIAEGIEKDTSAEDAAKKKAENIVNAFKTELDKIQLDQETSDLQYEIWNELNSTASKEEKYLRALEYQQAKLQKQSERIMAADAEYKATVIALGADSEEAQEAQNKYLKEYLNGVQYSKELLELQASQLETTVTRDDLGRFIVGNIAYGITSDMSAEEAASQKAANIVAAFQKGLDQLDVDLTTSDLEYKVWEAAHGNAGNQEKVYRKAQLLDEKLSLQARKTMTAEGRWKALQEANADAEQINEAYTQYLQEQLEMYDLADELAELQKDSSYKSAMANASYYEKLDAGKLDVVINDSESKKIYDSYMDTAEVVVVGITDAVDDADEAVSDGLIEAKELLDSLVQNVSVDFRDDLSDAATSAVEYAIHNAGAAAQNATEEELSNWWMMVQNATGWLSDSTDKNYVEGIKIGSYTVGGVIEGVKDKGSELLDKANTLWDEVTNSAEETFKIDSPSKVFTQIGEYCVMGLILGLQNLMGDASDAGESLADSTVNSMSGIVARIDEVLNSDIDYQPVIAPVLDLTDIRQNAAQLYELLDANRSYAIAAQASSRNDISVQNAAVEAISDLRGELGRFFTESVNAMHDALDDYADGLTVRITMQTPDGRILAEELVDPMIQVSRSRGTPFYTPNR